MRKKVKAMSFFFENSSFFSSLFFWEALNLLLVLVTSLPRLEGL